MIKDLREFTPFVLGLADDVFDFVRNSVLSASPSMRLGAERAKGLQLSAVVFIVLLSVFIKSAVAPKIDVLSYGLFCVGYFAVIGFLVTLYVRRSIPADLRTAQIEKAVKSESRENPFNESIDAHSYVLSFNLIALFVFAVAREFAIRFGYRDDFRTADWIAAGLAVVVTSIIFLSLRPKTGATDSSIGLSALQKVILSLLLSAMFLLYVQFINMIG